MKILPWWRIRSAGWALVSRDPYVTEGVFNRVEVKPFQQVLP